MQGSQMQLSAEMIKYLKVLNYKLCLKIETNTLINSLGVYLYAKKTVFFL